MNGVMIPATSESARIFLVTGGTDLLQRTIARFCAY
jgi:hypothetical protein